MAVADTGDPVSRGVARQEDRHVVRFGCRRDLAQRSGEVDVADLFGPEIVFRHESEPSVDAQSPWSGNAPTGFFVDFAMQCGDWVFARVDAATGKL